MRRREFIALFGGAAPSLVLWPLAARAQQPAMPVIGFLGSAEPDLYADRLSGFHLGLKEAGYIEGQNVAIEYRWAEGRNDRLPVLAAELVQRQVTVIVAGGGTPSALAAQAATAAIPIVFAVAVDPVEVGLVASLNRPGGNLTGVTNLNVEVGPKRLELVRELIPTATRVVVLVNPSSAVLTEQFSRDLEAAAPVLGMQLDVLHASTDRDLDKVFAAWGQLRADALIISPDNFFYTRSKQLGALALRHAVPMISQNRFFARAGGLIGYGGSERDYYRLVGVYTGKVLNGEKPAALRRVQPASRPHAHLSADEHQTIFGPERASDKPSRGPSQRAPQRVGECREAKDYERVCPRSRASRSGVAALGSHAPYEGSSRIPLNRRARFRWRGFFSKDIALGKTSRAIN